MNNVRRKQIEKIIDILEEVKSDLEDVQSDEQDYYDNMPENLLTSIRAENSEEAIDYMETAIDGLDEAIEALGSIE